MVGWFEDDICKVGEEIAELKRWRRTILFFFCWSLVRVLKGMKETGGVWELVHEQGRSMMEGEAG